MIFGAAARTLRKAVTWRYRIQVSPLLARFIDFNGVDTGTNSVAVTADAQQNGAVRADDDSSCSLFDKRHYVK